MLQVLAVDVKARRAMLTQQSALVHSEHLPVTSLKRLSAGQLVQGYVAAVGPAGIAIRFYNHVRGFVERAHVPAAACADESALGQVLLARVLHVDLKRKALRLSLFLHVHTSTSYSHSYLLHSCRLHVRFCNAPMHIITICCFTRRCFYIRVLCTFSDLYLVLLCMYYTLLCIRIYSSSVHVLVLYLM